MTNSITIIAVLLVCGPVWAQEKEAITKPGKAWKLIWSEEFEAEQLDASRWTRCKRGKADWKNTMSDRADLVKLEDGVLQLRGIVNPDQTKDSAPFLTAGLSSKGKFAFKYGKVQIRSRFKSAQGAWPALWMLGEDKGWPKNGEIDLMEHLNFEDRVFQTVHSEYTIKLAKENKPPKGSTTKINKDQWNTYGCEWDADKLVFTVNGVKTHTYPRVPELGEAQWPFNQDFYFILSMQIGGSWVNASGVSNPAHYPAWMEVDWVRVYQNVNSENSTKKPKDANSQK